MRLSRTAISLSLLLLSVATGKADSPTQALVTVPVACVRTAPRHSAELCTQATLGTPVSITAETDGWREVTLPDGYKGYIIDNSLSLLSADELERWKCSPRVMTTAHTASIMSDSSPATQVSDTHYGDITLLLNYLPQSEDMRVQLPDGRTGILSAADAAPLDSVMTRYKDAQRAIADALARAESMMGQTYLWGGTSAVASDCSGFTRICFQPAGVLLPRDAWQQAECGEAVSSLENARPGDLIFFANRRGRVNHVGIYIGNGKMVHCSGRVKINSIDNPTHADYYGQPPVAIRRIIADDGSQLPGITYFQTSPLYVSQ